MRSFAFSLAEKAPGSPVTWLPRAAVVMTPMLLLVKSCSSCWHTMFRIGILVKIAASHLRSILSLILWIL